MKQDNAMRTYKANLAATAHSGVSISELSEGADNLIDQLARAHNVGRSTIARQLLEEQIERDPEGVAAVVIARIGKAKRARAPRRHIYGRVKPEQPRVTIRAQDAVCREIHGAVPVGGCRYPNCGCKV